MFSRDSLRLDAAAESARIEAWLRTEVLQHLRRRGLVVGVSGGIDSSLVAVLAARALGPERVLALLMPERDSTADSSRLGRALVDWLGVTRVDEDVEPILRAAGCYARQREAIRMVFPEFDDGWRCKLTLPPLADSARLNVFQLCVQDPRGVVRTSRMPAVAFWALVAATNFKQRVRKMMEYHHADRLLYAVAGTPNRLEYDQGFFVKQGDGAADVKPIAHLYKTQVYALAEHLGVPEEIRTRPPTTETYSMPQTQEEFFFALPLLDVDLCLYAKDHGVPAAEVAQALDRPVAVIERVFVDLEAKRRAARYLHAQPGHPPDERFQAVA